MRGPPPGSSSRFGIPNPRSASIFSSSSSSSFLVGSFFSKGRRSWEHENVVVGWLVCGTNPSLRQVDWPTLTCQSCSKDRKDKEAEEEFWFVVMWRDLSRRFRLVRCCWYFTQIPPQREAEADFRIVDLFLTQSTVDTFLRSFCRELKLNVIYKSESTAWKLLLTLEDEILPFHYI